MPWNHCENEFILDDEDCPDCGFTKAEWTVQVDVTRTLMVTGARRRKKASVDWIELEVRDSLGEPAGQQAFRVLLPDGRSREGALAADGSARIEDVPPGDCQLVFPGFGLDPQANGDTLRFVTGPEGGASVASGARHAVELARALCLELVDSSGRAIAGHAYTLTLPDGTVRRGRFGSDGHAREEDMPEGSCELVVEPHS